jgi:two-component system chemotaxis response regulator CheY
MKDILEGIQVLVVDDSPQYRNEIVSILKELGVKDINESENGEEAFNKIKFLEDIAESFDLVFSDINMPKMDGIKLLISIRNNPFTAKLPVVMFSTESEKNIILTAIGIGITDYLIKPFDKTVARNKIITILSKLKLK